MIPGNQPSPAARLFSLAGGLVFVASLGYFLYSYDVTFVRTVENTGVWPAAWDVALFSAFALHHSVFARERIRRWVARASGDLERSVYVWIASLLFAATCYLWQPVAGVVWDIASPMAWAFRAMQLIGIWLSGRGAALIDVWVLSGIRIPIARAPEFTLDGPYGWVRHPIYLGWFLMVFGVPRMTMTQLVFAVVSCAYVIVAIPFEERSLRRSSQGAYERYTDQVRWKILPFVY